MGRGLATVTVFLAAILNHDGNRARQRHARGHYSPLDRGGKGGDCCRVGHPGCHSEGNALLEDHLAQEHVDRLGGFHPQAGQHRSRFGLDPLVRLDLDRRFH
jgi:hypothetical protein